ncbi:unnamed protein product [Owenia fusiformis]|uniref:Uncharacterized protein n=1 Tax=Owenia fusiformis TaxID=6347 RepID=A0A8J1UQS3_OWEFU|nr:unnamed protein product [Owenia fusiformis]
MSKLGKFAKSDFTKCKICRLLYRSPISLPCLHSACEKCFKKQATNNSGEYSFTCPQCNETASLKDIKRDVFVGNITEVAYCNVNESRTCGHCKYRGGNNRCVQCRMHLCQDCTDAHLDNAKTRKHKIFPYADIREGYHDKDIRTNQLIECDKHTDQSLGHFCEDCTTIFCAVCLKEDHADHQTLTIKESSKYENILRQQRDSVNGRLTNLSNYRQYLQDYADEIETMKGNTVNDIEAQADALKALIDRRKEKLIDGVNTICENEKKGLASKIDSFESTISSINGVDSSLEILFQYGRPEEILSIYKDIMLRTEFFKNVQMEGIASKTHVKLQKGIIKQEVLEEMLGEVEVFQSSQDSLAMTGDQGITLGTTYNVQPDLILAFDPKIDTDENDPIPIAIDTNKHGEFVVLDSANKKIKTFNPEGEFLHEFTTTAKQPYDITVLPNAHIAVSDLDSNDKIKLYSREGEYQRSIKGEYQGPKGIACTTDGLVAVVNSSEQEITTHRVKDGEVVTTIEGKDDFGFDIVQEADRLCITKTNNLVLLDRQKPHVKVYSMEGKCLNQFNQSSQKVLGQPAGICVDGVGCIYISDHKHHQVVELRPDGSFVRVLLDKHSGLWQPLALTVTKAGLLAVTQQIGSVRLFKYK